MTRPNMVGAFYKNGRKVGDVLTAIPLSAPEAGQMGHTVPPEKKERYQLTVSGILMMRTGENQGTYEVDSNAARLRVYPRSCQAAGRTTKVVVELAP